MGLEVNAKVWVLCVIPEVIFLQHGVVQAAWQAPLLDMFNLHNQCVATECRLAFVSSSMQWTML